MDVHADDTAHNAERGTLAPPGTPSDHKGTRTPVPLGNRNARSSSSSSENDSAERPDRSQHSLPPDGSARQGRNTRKDRRKKRRIENARESVRQQSSWDPLVILENSGSVARDHLASERTFLAYVRTSLGLASMGVALVQLFTIADVTTRAVGGEVSPQARLAQRFAEPLGALTIALSLVVLLQGVFRFFNIQAKLPAGRFPIARMSAVFTGVTLSAVIITIFVAILSTKS